MARYLVDDTAAEIEYECSSELQRVLQNVKNLLRLKMGELPYDRMRGIDPAIYDMNLAEANERILPEMDRVLAWEPRAVAMSANVALNSSGGTVISVEVEI